jgi:CheY-like chemotaxis protein
MPPFSPHESKRGILIVNDLPELRTYYKSILEGAEHNSVFEAGSSVDALRLLREHDIYVILLDFMMSKMHGVGVVNYLANAHRLPAGVLMTTYWAEEALDAGFSRCGNDMVMPQALIACSREGRLTANDVQKVLLPEIKRVIRNTHSRRIAQASAVDERIEKTLDEIDLWLEEPSLSSELASQLAQIQEYRRYH